MCILDQPQSLFSLNIFVIIFIYVGQNLNKNSDVYFLLTTKVTPTNSLSHVIFILRCIRQMTVLYMRSPCNGNVCKVNTYWYPADRVGLQISFLVSTSVHLSHNGCDIFRNHFTSSASFHSPHLQPCFSFSGDDGLFQQNKEISTIRERQESVSRYDHQASGCCTGTNTRLIQTALIMYGIWCRPQKISYNKNKSFIDSLIKITG